MLILGAGDLGRDERQNLVHEAIRSYEIAASLFHTTIWFIFFFGFSVRGTMHASRFRPSSLFLNLRFLRLDLILRFFLSNSYLPECELLTSADAEGYKTPR